MRPQMTVMVVNTRRTISFIPYRSPTLPQKGPRTAASKGGTLRITPDQRARPSHPLHSQLCDVERQEGHDQGETEEDEAGGDIHRQLVSSPAFPGGASRRRSGRWVNRRSRPFLGRGRARV